ncbi:MAG: AmmeMemoRadiSam system protein B [Candidatus Heimdallarchaeota archaeon]|nr:AmmeMemoRadiSam system protein B [Candidatus Heimdallarchaeota archaeon]
MIRNAQYAGSFYSSNAEQLVESIERCFNSSLGPQSLPLKDPVETDPHPFLLVPHAGYTYSGPVAAWSYFELSKYPSPDTVVILGPNHTGLGSDIGVPNKIKTWKTPLGEIKVNQELIEGMLEQSILIERSDDSHAREHSIEVQLPFLQYVIGNDFDFLPITLLNQSIDSSMMLGEIIAKVCEGKNVLVIASSDFTHFESHDSATKKDNQILEAIERMDTKTMYEIKYRLGVSMCGYGPIAGTMEVAKRTGRTRTKLLKYATSGDSFGDKGSVVGYGAAAFYMKQ